MGWEYGIKVANVKDIKALMERLAEALPRIDGYRMQRDEDGFVLLQNNSDWPEALQISLEEARNIEDLEDDEPYIYCLFHIGGGDAMRLREGMCRVLEEEKCAADWFEL
ncbi:MULTISPECIES: hypothetical protein [Paenibacillus]|uniref:Uncharacterized protein n=1 Tax=Paenibacillus polymyxa TaxID=1406 RepID=A0A0F6EPW6_PAEPO|nr:MULTISPECIES: hypothetical protein [Paenibacillus]MEB4782847.1 hypothetical protein [Paenibacillus jamilae]AHM67240.1 hypothetical protein PPSQR21_036020 [Paenibacillus polymyxa SQR-21]AIY08030.1 hypothetical protein LK13_05210 [Paenibacillus polymyxa]KAE8558374.1 hypothetical protein BJH92_20270 [Paenibacillus polymyxa]KAF6585990.1 hypothetical protein G9G57_04640 [Paenibacillus sp. EKM211P]